MSKYGPTRTAGSLPTSRDRGVSEVLSYVLVFTMIVSAIGIVTVGGLGSLQDARATEQANNADRAYDVLADNMADVHAEGAPSRATEIALGTSELFFADNVTMTVQVEEGGLSRTHSFDLRPIVFRIGSGTRLVYEAGAVIRDERQGGSVVVDPPFSFDEENVYIPIVRTTAPAVESVGSTTVLVRGESTNRSVLESTVTGSLEIEHIEISRSPRSAIWERYFDEQPYCDGVTVAGDTVRCEVDGSAFDDPDRFALTLQQIEISLVT